MRRSIFIRASSASVCPVVTNQRWRWLGKERLTGYHGCGGIFGDYGSNADVFGNKRREMSIEI